MKLETRPSHEYLLHLIGEAACLTALNFNLSPIIGRGHLQERGVVHNQDGGPG